MQMFRQWRVIIGLVIIIVIATVAISAILPAGAAPTFAMPRGATPTTTHIPAPPAPLPIACAGQAALCPLAISLLNEQGQVQLTGNLGSQPQADSAFPFGKINPTQQLFVTGNDVNILLTLVNPTDATETITSVELRVVTFTPFTGTIANAFAACDMRAYANGTAKPPTDVKPGNDCTFNTSPSITYGYPVSLSPTVTSGIVVPLTLGITNQGQQVTGPAIIPAYQKSNGQTTLLDVAIAPNLSGTYVFQVGVAIKGHPLTFFDTTLTALAVTQDAIDHYWSAENCTIPDNSWQVPTTGAYLCPGPVATE